MNYMFNKTFVIAIVFGSLFFYGCSRDPLGLFYEVPPGPFTEQVGPYLRITFNPGPDRFPCWNGDGTLILYSAPGFEPKTQGYITINVIPSSGGTSKRISPAFGRMDANRFPCWVNNLHQAAYISFRRIGNLAMVPSFTIVDVDDMSEFSENLIGLYGTVDMAVSPDESAVIYSDFPLISWYRDNTIFGSGEEIGYVRETSHLTSITNLFYSSYPPTGAGKRIDGARGARELTWSPDSDSIAFSRDEIIYVISLEGGVPRELFEGESPAWSPDGSEMACVIDGNIFVYRMSDGHRTQITTEGGLDPAWSPDGEKLAFSWAKDGGDVDLDIYIVHLDDIIISR